MRAFEFQNILGGGRRMGKGERAGCTSLHIKYKYTRGLFDGLGPSGRVLLTELW